MKKWTGEKECTRLNKMARRGKDNDHTKSGQLRRRRQYRIQYVMMMMMILSIKLIL